MVYAACMLIDCTAHHNEEKNAKDTREDIRKNDDLSLVAPQPFAQLIISPKSYGREEVDR